MMFSSSLIMVFMAPCFKELLPFVPIYTNFAIVGAPVLMDTFLVLIVFAVDPIVYTEPCTT